MRARTREKYEKPFRIEQTLQVRFKLRFCLAKPFSLFGKPFSRGFPVLKHSAFGDFAPTDSVKTWVGSKIHANLLAMRSTAVVIGKDLSLDVSGLLSLLDNAISNGGTDWDGWKRTHRDQLLTLSAEIDARRGLGPILAGRDLEWKARLVFADTIIPDPPSKPKPTLGLNLETLDGPLSAVTDPETGVAHEQAGLF